MLKHTHKNSLGANGSSCCLGFGDLETCLCYGSAVKKAIQSSSSRNWNWSSVQTAV